MILRAVDSARALAVIKRVSAIRAPDARLLVSLELNVAEISVPRSGMRRSLQEMAPGEERDLTRLRIPGPAGLSLEPLLNYQRTDLLGALVALLRHRGQWEAAANELGVHRNALRHRTGTSRRVMGADLNDPDVASTIWLTLGARGLT